MSIAARAAKAITWTFDTTVSPQNDIIRERVLLDGGGSFTGKGVSVDKAMGFVPVMAAIRLLSETIGSLPLPIYRRLPRGKEQAPDHRLYSLLHDQANPEMSAMVFKEVTQSHALAWGTGYAEIEFDRDGFPLYLWPLNAGNMSVVRDDGTLWFLYRTPDGKEQRLSAKQVFRLPALGSNGITGYSPIHMARQALALGLAAEEMAGRFYQNDARPGVVLKHPGELSTDAATRLAESFDATHSGLSNKHRTAVLEEGMDIETVGFPADDAQLIEQQKWSVEQVCRIFNVPPHMLHSLERATFNNIEEMGLNFVTYSLRPWLVRWEQQIKMQLLTDDAAHFAEFNVEGLLRGKIADRMAAFWQQFQMGSMSPNEIRSKENLNPIEGGDFYYRPVNLSPLVEPEIQRANLAEQAEVAGQLIRAGYDPVSVSQFLGLPVEHTGDAPVTTREAEESPELQLLPGGRSKAIDADAVQKYQPLFEEVTRNLIDLERRMVMREAERRLTDQQTETTKSVVEALADLATRPQPIPQMTVNVPEQPPAVINVTLPEQRPTRKSITRREDGFDVVETPE